jgi:hypothetical protein
VALPAQRMSAVRIIKARTNEAGRAGRAAHRAVGRGEQTLPSREGTRSEDSGLPPTHAAHQFARLAGQEAWIVAVEAGLALRARGGGRSAQGLAAGRVVGEAALGAGLPNGVSGGVQGKAGRAGRRAWGVRRPGRGQSGECRRKFPGRSQRTRSRAGGRSSDQSRSLCKSRGPPCRRRCPPRTGCTPWNRPHRRSSCGSPSGVRD